MRIQKGSEGQKYGDSNKSHVLATRRVVLFWAKFARPEYQKWILDNSWVEQYSEKFIKDNKLKESGKDHFFHTPDLVFFEWHEDRPILKLVIEVDGESHDKPTRKISDGIFQKWINQRYGDVPLIRLKKAELELDLTLAHQYLWEQLADFLQ